MKTVMVMMNMAKKLTTVMMNNGQLGGNLKSHSSNLKK